MPSKKKEPEKENIIEHLLADEPAIRAGIKEHDGDTLVQVALVNVKGAIGNLKQALATTAHLARPPARTDAGRSEDGTPRGPSTKVIARTEAGKQIHRK